MKIRRHMTLLLAVVMLLCVVSAPAAAVEEDAGTQLYYQAPGDVREGDSKWQVNSNDCTIANFTLRKVDGSFKMAQYYNNRSSTGSGLPLDADGNIVPMEFILPDVMLDTNAYGEMELYFQYVVYEHFVRMDFVNNFQVYVSTDGGKTWSENYAGMKAHNLIGFGTGPNIAINNIGSDIECYEVVSEDLTALVKDGAVINAVKIIPAAEFETFQYNICVKEISITGYKDKAPARPEEKVEYIELGEDLMRKIVVNQAYYTADMEWTTDEKILSYNASSPTPGTDLHYEAGFLYRGPVYARGIDATTEMLAANIQDKKYVGGGTTWDTVHGFDCINVVFDALVRVCDTEGGHTFMYTMSDDHVQLVGGLKNEPFVRDTGKIIKRYTQQEIFEAYAQMKIGDYVILQQTGQHTRLVTVVPNVVRNSDGTIDPDRSTVGLTETAGTVRYYFLAPTGKIVRTEEKDIASYQQAHPDYTYLYGTSMRIDLNYTFGALIDNEYLPFTITDYAEGRVEVQNVRIDTDATAANIVKEGFLGYVKSNYYISDVVVTLTDAAGKELYKDVQYGEIHDFFACAGSNELDGILAGLKGGSYKLTVDVRSGPVTRIMGKAPVTCVFELDFNA